MTFTEADVGYISASFVTLEALCDGRGETLADVETLMADGRLPRPSYVLDDGTRMFPADYFALPLDPGWRQELREQIDELDALEREFAPDYDRAGRFGRLPTRDLLIGAARDRFPEVFADRSRAAAT